MRNGETIGETVFVRVVFDVESSPPMPLGLY